MIRGLRAVSNACRAVALLAGLAACQNPAPPAPLAAAPAPDLVFTMADGTVLPARSWLPPRAKPWLGVILALHGFTDSRDAWELPAPGFAAAGYAVFAPDQRGFGGTATRGIWQGIAPMLDDAASLLTILRARYPGQRLTLMGESMGGAIALCLAARPAPPQDATVLLAPAVWSRDDMSPLLRSALWTADQAAPGLVLTGSAVPLDIAASDNREALIRLARDPLTLRGANVAMLRGLVDLMDAAQSAAPSVHGQVLVLDGRRDQVVPPPATARAWSRLPENVRRGFYLSGYHLLLRDQARALPQADILAWLDNPERWLPSGADINAASWQASQAWSPTPAPARLLDATGAKPVWPY